MGWKLEAAGAWRKSLGREPLGVQDIAGIRFGLGKGCSGVRPPTLTAERPLLRTLFLSLLELTRPSFNFRGPSGANATNGAKRRAKALKLDMRLLRNGFRIQMGPLHAEEVGHEEPATATRRDSG